MADNRIMEELLQAPTEGYRESIVIPEINADHFEIKTNLLQLVQANPYHGFERENPHTHINNFKRITLTLKFRDVPNDGNNFQPFQVPIQGFQNQPFQVPNNPVQQEPDVPKTLPNTNMPYPSRLNDQKLHEKATNQMQKFFQIFQDLHFDISFADSLLLMPKFASTIKSLLTNKDTLFELAKIPLNENFSTILLKKLPKKLGYPGKFLIPYDFPGMNVCHALVDLGASINLMPLFIWKKISLPKLTPTRMTLELANRSNTRPKGVAEDVFVKVRKFHFSNDFVVVDFEADPRVPIILGRSFLRIGRDLVDVYGEEITLRVNDEAVTFNLNQTTRYSFTYDDLSGSDFILKEIDAFLRDDSVSLEIDHADFDPEGDICLIEKLLNNDPFQLFSMDLKQGEVVKEKASIEEPPKLELKELPSHLEYAYLEDGISGYFQIPINPPDQEKTTFTCPYGTFAYRRMPFGLCNAPGTFQRYMMPIFHDMIEKSMEVFMDDVLVFGDSFSSCLSHLDTILQRPMTHLLEKDTSFVFSKDCIDAFETLKKKLTEAPILVVLDRNVPFELMCDASDFTIGAVLRQRKTKHFQPIHYASKTMTEAQIHSTMTEKEMLAVLLLQEFDIIIRDKKGTENLAADHLSKLENPHKDVFENKDINEDFPLETLGKISSGSTPWFADFANFHAGNFIVKGMSSQQKKKFFKDDAHDLVKSFDVWGIDFTGPFPSSRGNRYILVAVDYLSKWVEAKALPTNDARVIVKFLKSLFARFGTPRAIISDRGTYFCNDKFAKLMSKYGVTRRLSTAYHPQTSGQVEALKHVNFDLKTAGDHRKLQLNELNQLRDQAYKNSLIYKEKTKKIHDSKIKNHIFNVGDRVLLFNSRLKIFSGKLKTRWSGPFTITKVFPYRTIELSQPGGPDFKVNGHCVKHYFGGDVPHLVVPDLQTFPMDK
uniref:Reverse transcriptase domain-containing protein n=1 Tax=Tanacetum cinerariifolium TaxID=118510 RepID=A0A6L2M8V8_TANCI|nr:reverse transcriptase domain-containing protein [Tanacetum cinerariifolium]